jgi:hypothetical protein
VVRFTWQPRYPPAKPDSRHTDLVSASLASPCQNLIAEGKQGELRLFSEVMDKILQAEKIRLLDKSIKEVFRYD